MYQKVHSREEKFITINFMMYTTFIKILQYKLMAKAHTHTHHLVWGEVNFNNTIVNNKYISKIQELKTILIKLTSFAIKICRENI